MDFVPLGALKQPKASCTVSAVDGPAVSGGNGPSTVGIVAAMCRVTGSAVFNLVVVVLVFLSGWDGRLGSDIFHLNYFDGGA